MDWSLMRPNQINFVPWPQAASLTPANSLSVCVPPPSLPIMSQLPGLGAQLEEDIKPTRTLGLC